MSQRSRMARASLVLVCLLSASSLASCSPGDAEADPSPSPTSVEPSSPTATPTPTTDPEIAAAEAAILNAYRGFWDAKVAAFADPVAEEAPALSQFAVDTALAELRANVHSLKANGITVTGTPVLTPQVSEVRLGAGATAVVTDCVDVSNWQPVFAATGQSAAPPDQPTRVLTTATAYFYDSRWTIRNSVVDRETPC